MGKHLMSHLTKIEKEYNKKKKGVSFLVKARAGEMFLMLWIDGKTTYAKIDSFLRQIWLECCGHMSVFSDSRDDIDMETSIVKNFSKQKKLLYDYDFGSTTRLEFIHVNKIDILINMRGLKHTLKGKSYKNLDLIKKMKLQLYR